MEKRPAVPDADESLWDLKGTRDTGLSGLFFSLRDSLQEEDE